MAWSPQPIDTRAFGVIPRMGSTPTPSAKYWSDGAGQVAIIMRRSEVIAAVLGRQTRV